MHKISNKHPNIHATPDYRAYKAQPFTRAERDSVEILFGGLHWRAERLIQAVFANLGYKSRPLPAATRHDLITGRELADIGQCCPTSFTTGNLVNFLRTHSNVTDVTKKYVHLTAGACGACRFGQYHQSYELALRNVGLDAFRMFLLAQDQFDQGEVDGGGIELNLPLTIGAIWAAMLADVLQDLEYQTRPYEVDQGQTDKVVADCVDFLCEKMRGRPRRGRKWSVVAWHVSTTSRRHPRYSSVSRRSRSTGFR